MSGVWEVRREATCKMTRSRDTSVGLDRDVDEVHAGMAEPAIGTRRRDSVKVARPAAPEEYGEHGGPHRRVAPVASDCAHPSA